MAESPMTILLERTSSLGAGDRPILNPLKRPIAPTRLVVGFQLSVADCEP
jgi:hypothetical protein